MGEISAEALLDAAFDVVADHGISRLSMADVARRAGVSRPTLYKHFSGKEALIEALVMREEAAILEACLSAAADHEDLVAALAAALRAVLDAARGHRVLDRLLSTEPETLLPYLVGGRLPVLQAADQAIHQIVSERLPHLTDAALAVATDALGRLIVSYSVSPSALDHAAIAGTLATVFVHGMTSTETATA